MNRIFEVESRTGARAGQSILRLNGAIGLETVPQFLKAVRGESAPALILDFNGVSYVDSAGVGALVQSYVAFQKAGRRLVLAALNDRVQAVLEVTRVQSLFPVFGSVAEAEEKLGGRE